MTLERLLAKDVMTKPVRSLDADSPLKEAARFLLGQHFSGAPVLDEAGRPIGVLSLRDIALYMEWHLEVEESEEERENGGRPRDEASYEGHERIPGRGFHTDRLAHATVRQVMTEGLHTVEEGAPLRTVVGTLLEGPYHRVFVTDRGGVLVGVISTLDVVRAMGNSFGGAGAAPAVRTIPRRRAGGGASRAPRAGGSRGPRRRRARRGSGA